MHVNSVNDLDHVVPTVYTGDFVASRGRLERFFERHSFSLHRRTTVGQWIPSDLEPKVTSFVINTRRL